MLVLTRHVNETVMLGDRVSVTVLEIRGDKVRLGFDGPEELPIHRHEVWLAIKKQEQGDEPK